MLLVSINVSLEKDSVIFNNMLCMLRVWPYFLMDKTNFT